MHLNERIVVRKHRDKLYIAEANTLVVRLNIQTFTEENLTTKIIYVRNDDFE